MATTMTAAAAAAAAAAAGSPFAVAVDRELGCSRLASGQRLCCYRRCSQKEYVYPRGTTYRIFHGARSDSRCGAASATSSAKAQAQAQQAIAFTVQRETPAGATRHGL